MNKPLIIAENIIKTYKIGEIEINALRGVSFEIYNGDFVSIMGASGSGKSTMMNILGCLDRPTSGKYLFKDNDITNLNNNELAKIRRDNIGFVFQSYNLLARTTSFDNVEMPLIYAKKYKSRERKIMVQNALESVGLADRMHNKSNQLSGGQQQRVAIARAIVNNPSVIFADEPTGNLDSETSVEIMNIFMELNKQGTTIVLVTHENDVADYCKSKMIFKDGKLISNINLTN